MLYLHQKLRKHRSRVPNASGIRSISYDHYGNLSEENIQVGSLRYTTQEHWDAYGRSTGYVLQKNGNRACGVSQAYGTYGRIAVASFIHANVEHKFHYGYLPGSDLLQTLSMPNGVTLTQEYEEKRNLLIGMDYVRENSLVTQRRYTYDALARPETRDTRYPNKGISHNDSFAYNHRSELTGALLDNSAYTYAYDNIGNREIAQESAEGITYAANELNQYTRISTDGENFTPEYDADGNQILVQTSTGIWRVTYNAQNRAVMFESTDGSTLITCAYDYAGRRFEKKVVSNGTIATHQRFIYRGYLQIAAVNLKADASTPDLWFLIWDPTQTVATRPLAIRKDGTWYTYGWDLTKNVCELYGQQGYIRTIYRYSPYGAVIAEGNVEQVIQWSSEYYDSETSLTYYNYRYYNPLDGRWTRRDLISILNLMEYCLNAPISFYDVLGTWVAGTQAGAKSTDWRGHSDMGQLPGMDYAKEDFGENAPFKKPGLHFMNLVEVEPMLLEAVKSCNKDSFESNMHRMQDFFSHYSQGYRWPETLGHIFRSSYPDNPDAHKEQFDLAISRTEQWERRWLTCCCRKKDGTWTRRDENDPQCGGITIPSNDYKIEPSIGEINWNASQYEEKAMHEAYKEMIRRNNTNIKNNAERMEESIRKVPINVKYTHPWYGL